MDQEQRIEKAKWCGLFLVALCFSLLALFWTIWTEANLLLLVFALITFTFFLYQTLVMDAYSIFAYAVIKYLKCTRLHNFFQEKTKKKPLSQLWQFSETEQPKVASYQEIYEREDKPEMRQTKGGLVVSRKKQAMRLYKNKAKNMQKEKGLVPQLSVERSPDRFKVADKKYKESTLRVFEEKGINKQLLEQICMLVKNNYSNKVEQLLELSDDNEKAIIALAEQHFQIKIMELQEQLPEKLQPVLLDDLINRIRVFQFTQCLPWAPKASDDQTLRKAIQALKELVDWRLKIDDTLCPYANLTHQTRHKLMNRLSMQLREEKPGRDLLILLVGLFNENIKKEEYKLRVKMVGQNLGGVQIVESWIGQRLHLDLQMVRQEVSKVYNVKPGENNIWYLLGIAAELYRLRL